MIYLCSLQPPPPSGKKATQQKSHLKNRDSKFEGETRSTRAAARAHLKHGPLLFQRGSGTNRNGYGTWVWGVGGVGAVGGGGGSGDLVLWGANVLNHHLG